MQSVWKCAGTQTEAENTPWSQGCCTFLKESQQAWDTAWAAAHLCSNLKCPHLCFTLASAGFESSWMLRQCDHATQLFLPLVREPSQRKNYMCLCFLCGRMAHKIFVGGFSNILEAGVPGTIASGSGGFCLQQGFLPNTQVASPLWRFPPHFPQLLSLFYSLSLQTAGLGLLGLCK